MPPYLGPQRRRWPAARAPPPSCSPCGQTRPPPGAEWLAAAVQGGGLTGQCQADGRQQRMFSAVARPCTCVRTRVARFWPITPNVQPCQVGRGTVTGKARQVRVRDVPPLLAVVAAAAHPGPGPAWKVSSARQPRPMPRKTRPHLEPPLPARAGARDEGRLWADGWTATMPCQTNCAHACPQDRPGCETAPVTPPRPSPDPSQ